MLYNYLVGSVLGLLAGFVFYKLSIKQIAKRSKDPQKQNAFKKPGILVAWLAASVIFFIAIIYRQDGQVTAKTIEYLIYVSILINIAAVDFLIRKVPNELLLLLLFAKAVFIVVDLINKIPLRDSLITPAIGLAVGLLLFSIPSLLKIYIGAGDIKLSAVIGFCLGYFLYLQAMALMSGMLLVYLIFLIVSKKGNLRTLTSMGPYLAFGSLITMMFPLTDFYLRSH